jgi:hypothetical protein
MNNRSDALLASDFLNSRSIVWTRNDFMMTPRHLHITCFFIVTLFLAISCAPAPQTPSAPDDSSADPAPVNLDSAILQRARIWVDNKVPYGSFDNDRTNDYYRGYRADCSGFVSYAWGLSEPGPNTTDLLNSEFATQIQIDDLSPGDALNNGGGGKDGHIVLFVQWKDQAKHTFIAYDENTYPGYASEKTYTLVQILNSGEWTIKELDRYAAGPYYAQHLISSDDVPFAGVPPAAGVYPINRTISRSGEWDVTLDSIEVRDDGTLKVNYSWLNLSSQSESLSGDDQVRMVIQLRDGSTLEELDTDHCGAGDENEAGPNQAVTCWSTLGRLDDGTNPFTLFYVGVGQVDDIVLRK